MILSTNNNNNLNILITNSRELYEAYEILNNYSLERLEDEQNISWLDLIDWIIPLYNGVQDPWKLIDTNNLNWYINFNDLNIPKGSFLKRLWNTIAADKDNNNIPDWLDSILSWQEKNKDGWSIEAIFAKIVGILLSGKIMITIYSDNSNDNEEDDDDIKKNEK